MHTSYTCVALLTESVDWNKAWSTTAYKGLSSLSSRRAWIEIIRMKVQEVIQNLVALLTESVDWNWVTNAILSATSGRSPHGERGLKYHTFTCFATLLQSLSSRRAWIEIIFLSSFKSIYFFVALLTESVDWNRSRRIAVYMCGRSLSSRRAWIEIRACCDNRLMDWNF